MVNMTGWNTWDVQHLNAVVHVPSGVRVRFNLFDTATNQSCETFDWRTGMHHLGPHATDGSYAEIDLKWNHSIVRFEYAAEGDRLVCRISPITPAEMVRESSLPLTLLVDLDIWERAVDIHPRPTAQAAVVNIKTTGVLQIPTSQKATPITLGDRSALAFTLDQPMLVQVLAQEQAASPVPSPDELSHWIADKRAAYNSTGLRSNGWLSDAASGLTRAIAWNTIWEPVKGRICTPVSRDWCKGAMFGSYVLFDWDTFFCAVMAALEDPALASANAHAILQEVTARGFVPNFGCQFGPSEDRSQPPVGAYCVLKLYRAASLGADRSARSLLETTFPALLRWHEWWLPNRDGNKDGLLEWGSDPQTGAREWQWDNMQAAMYESGLDNSPMYDDTNFNAQTHTMELADVGLNAMYAMDAWALSEIATLLGLSDEAQRLTEDYNATAERINRDMWSEASGIYMNKHWDGRLSPHLSPTNFYPLIAGIAPRERAERMVREHLLNGNEFWGRYVIPSTARNDPGYGGNDYWRGRIWGPMNFLVAEGLRRYRFDTELHEFARRGLDLFLDEWHNESHVHENYNTETGDGDDVRNSDPVYTWGALLAYIAMQELADAEPWGGWRFGNLNRASASIRGIRVAEGVLDVETGPDGLSVQLNGTLLLATDRPALITGFRFETNRLMCRATLDTEMETTLRFGHLLPNTSVAVRIGHAVQQPVTSPTGQCTLHSTGSQEIEITWSR